VINEPSPGSFRRRTQIRYMAAEDIDIVVAADPGTDHKAPRDSTQVSFEAFYRKEMAALIRFMRRYGADVYSAADAVQDAFTEAYPQWEAIGEPRAWLRLVACRIYYRRRLRETPVEDVPDRPMIYQDPVEAREQSHRVFEALAALPERQRQVMAWHLDGYGHAEIAGLLGISQAAVRQNLSRARRALKSSFGLSQGEQEGETR
jgi:RNA polymerase sigma factor (sigma-70 family)